MTNDGLQVSMDDFTIGPARVDQAADIVALVQASFETSRSRFLAYAQPGMANYIAVILRNPTATPDRLILAATGPVGELVGFADFRMPSVGVGFLSYVAVAESARNRGIARALISRFVEQHPHIELIRLDVFRDNAAARRLYERMGFTYESTTLWVTRDLPDSNALARTSGLPPALASLAEYGFCELKVRLEGGDDDIVIGVIGETVVNARSTQAFVNDDLLGGVRALFPDLEIAFVSIPESQRSELPAAHRIEGLSDRMSLTLHNNKLKGQPT
jgi:ribosomal protein S18 acetylase RimI-like enzyme